MDPDGRRVMFIGKAVDADRVKFRQFGRAMGFAAAELGLAIVVGSDSATTLDAAVIDGAADYARSHGRRVPWFVFEPDDGKRRFEVPPQGLGAPVRWVLPRGETRWATAHLSAVMTAHAVVAMGGSNNTYRACRAAEERGLPVWPVPDFGGAAAERFDALTHPDSAEDSVERAHARALVDASSELKRRDYVSGASQWLKRVRASIRRRLRRRVYFLSYARQDEAIADQVEMFLRRHKRGVLRDEVTFVPGSDLADQIGQAISSADEFLVLDSDHSAASKYVNDEIQIAQALIAAGALSPARALGLLLNGMPARTSIDPAVLHLPGHSRVDREQSVARAVRTEGKWPPRTPRRG